MMSLCFAQTISWTGARIASFQLGFNDSKVLAYSPRPFVLRFIEGEP